MMRYTCAHREKLPGKTMRQAGMQVRGPHQFNDQGRSSITYVIPKPGTFASILNAIIQLRVFDDDGQVHDQETHSTLQKLVYTCRGDKHEVILLLG